DLFPTLTSHETRKLRVAIIHTLAHCAEDEKSVMGGPSFPGGIGKRCEDFGRLFLSGWNDHLNELNATGESRSYDSEYCEPALLGLANSAKHPRILRDRIAPQWEILYPKVIETLKKESKTSHNLRYSAIRLSAYFLDS